nr:hypothetical protein [Candidatus Sigynarchaeota archaeon]
MGSERMYQYESRDKDRIQHVELALQPDGSFLLSNRVSGHFGTNRNSYTGRWNTRDNEILLHIIQIQHYSFYVVDDEPDERSRDATFDVSCTIAGDTLTLIFPFSDSWKVVLKEMKAA